MATKEAPLELNRSRRLINLTSLAVLLHWWLEIEVGTEASFSGLIGDMGRPERVKTALMILLGWALLRYCQRLYEWWAEVRKEILEDVNAEQLRIALKMARVRAREIAESGEWTDNERPKRVRVVRIGVAPTMQEALDARGIEISTGEDGHVFRDAKGGGKIYDRLSVQLEYELEGERRNEGRDFQMPLSKWQVRRLKSWAWFHATWRLPGTLDLIAPLGLAAAALWVGLI